MVHFNMSNGPFLEHYTLESYSYDLIDIYPHIDTNGGCNYPRKIPLTIEDQDAYVGSTVPRNLSFSQEHCQGIKMSVTTGTLPTFTSNQDSILVFDPTLNSQQGTYTISVTVTDPKNLAVGGSFNLVVHANQEPQINAPPGDQSIWALQDFELLLDITDNEQNPISYEVKKSDGQTMPTWLSWDQETRKLSGIPTNSDVETIDITITFWDQYIIDAKLSHTFNLEVKTNLPPQITGTLPSVPDITVPFSIDYDHSLLSFFDDREQDDVILTVTESPDAPWLNYDINTHKISGNPPDNTHAQTYTITI